VRDKFLCPYKTLLKLRFYIRLPGLSTRLNIWFTLRQWAPSPLIIIVVTIQWIFRFMAQQPIMVHGHLIEAWRSHSHTSHTVAFLWTWDQRDAEISDSTEPSKSQQARGRRHKPYTARQLGSALAVFPFLIHMRCPELPCSVPTYVSTCLSCT